MASCLAGLSSDHGADAYVAFADLVHAAIDRNLLDRARAWLDAAKIAQPRLGESAPFKLAQLRLAVASRSDAVAVPEAAETANESADGRHLRWQAQALRAALLCRDSRPEGAAQRAGLLAEVVREEPERLQLQHRLATITADCVPSLASRVRGRLP
jgi:hypothetical protein